MIVLVQANVLTVGLNGKSEALRKLPIRIIEKQSGFEAARSLKNENVNSVISKWDLVDMENGRFIRTLRAAKPDIATIVLVRTGDFGQEIAARSLGVSAVLSEDTPDYFFINTVADILGLHRLAPVTAVSGHRQSITRYTQNRPGRF